MRVLPLLSLLSACCECGSAAFVGLSPTAQQQMRAQGETLFTSLRQNTQAEQAGAEYSTSKSHACWAQSVAFIEGACSRMTVRDKQRLALNLANCHLADAHRVTYDCPDDVAAGKCASNLTDSAFDTYSQFFIHIGQCRRPWHAHLEAVGH